MPRTLWNIKLQLTDTERRVLLDVLREAVEIKPPVTKGGVIRDIIDAVNEEIEREST